MPNSAVRADVVAVGGSGVSQSDALGGVRVYAHGGVWVDAHSGVWVVAHSVVRVDTLGGIWVVSHSGVWVDVHSGVARTDACGVCGVLDRSRGVTRVIVARVEVTSGSAGSVAEIAGSVSGRHVARPAWAEGAHAIVLGEEGGHLARESRAYGNFRRGQSCVQQRRAVARERSCETGLYTRMPRVPDIYA